MIVLHDNFKNNIDFQTYIALGNFDGLHLGHMGLINKTLELSKKSCTKSLVCTFENHPLSVIYPERAPKLIMSNETKVALLDRLGIDMVNLAHFDEDFMKMSPQDFITNLVRSYNPKGIVVGFNHRFGYKNTGDVKLLSEYSKLLGFELHVIDSVSYDNEIVSSSLIRRLISEGNIKEANSLLLVPYFLEGTVVKGKQLGRTLGFPTANLKYDCNFVLPSIGVYYTIVEYNNNLYKGITSVGYNPTVETQNIKIHIETYILNFDKNIYSDLLKISFIDRIRDEIKFDSLEALTEQLKADKSYADKQNLEKFA